MTYYIKDTYPGTGTSITLDGVTYEIFLTDQANYDCFASVIVKDGLTGDRVFCNGIFENAKHRFLFRYETEYNANRDNWICNGNLKIDVL